MTLFLIPYLGKKNTAAVLTVGLKTFINHSVALYGLFN